MRTMVTNGDAAYEPEKQTSAVLLYWRRPEQWAETIHEWVRAPVCSCRYRVSLILPLRLKYCYFRCLPCMLIPCASAINGVGGRIIQVTNTGQLNTILTFYELIEPEIPSPLSGLPLALLTRAIAVLRKSGRAQMIDAADGGGVRFFAR